MPVQQYRICIPLRMRNDYPATSGIIFRIVFRRFAHVGQSANGRHDKNFFVRKSFAKGIDESSDSFFDDCKGAIRDIRSRFQIDRVKRFPTQIFYRFPFAKTTAAIALF